MKQKRLQRSIDQVVREVVRLVHPLRVILFGSAVRGELGPDSDLDLLIVVPEGRRAGEIADILYTGIRNKPWPCDFLVATPSVIARNRDKPGLIYDAILREGHEVYAM